MKGKDLTGQRFGRLIVIKQIGVDKKTRQKKWLCRCDCGSEKETITSYLTSGDTSSCGCYRSESEIKNLSKGWEKNKERLTTHGLSNSRLYTIWACIKQRCYNQKSTGFYLYGYRGIKMCREWKDNFINFYEWAINNGYKNNLTIDRIDTDGNYEPNNCRWATSKEQGNNKRNTRKITIYGKTKTAYEFEKQYGVRADLLIKRYDKGYRNQKLIYKGNLLDFREESPNEI